MIRTLGLLLVDSKGNTVQLCDYIADCLDYLKKDELLEIAYNNDIEDLPKGLSKSKIIEAILDRLEYMNNTELFDFLAKNEIGVSKTMLYETLQKHFDLKELCRKSYYKRGFGTQHFPLYRMDGFIDLLLILEHINPTYEPEKNIVLGVRPWADARKQ